MLFILAALVVSAQAYNDDISLLQTVARHHVDKAAQRGDESRYPTPPTVEPQPQYPTPPAVEPQPPTPRPLALQPQAQPQQAAPWVPTCRFQSYTNTDTAPGFEFSTTHQCEGGGTQGMLDGNQVCIFDTDDQMYEAMFVRTDGMCGRTILRRHCPAGAVKFSPDDIVMDGVMGKFLPEGAGDRVCQVVVVTQSLAFGNSLLQSRPPVGPTRPPASPIRPAPLAGPTRSRSSPARPVVPECIFEAYSESETQWFRLRATHECKGGRVDKTQDQAACIYDITDQLQDAKLVRTDGWCVKTTLKQDCTQGPKAIHNNAFTIDGVEKHDLPIGVGDKVCQVVIVTPQVPAGNNLLQLPTKTPTRPTRPTRPPVKPRPQRKVPQCMFETYSETNLGLQPAFQIKATRGCEGGAVGTFHGIKACIYKADGMGEYVRFAGLCGRTILTRATGLDIEPSHDDFVLDGTRATRLPNHVANNVKQIVVSWQSRRGGNGLLQKQARLPVAQCIVETQFEQGPHWRITATSECQGGEEGTFNGEKACFYEPLGDWANAGYLSQEGLCATTVLRTRCGEDERLDVLSSHTDFVLGGVRGRVIPSGLRKEVCEVVVMLP